MAIELSVILPCYMEAANLRVLFPRLLRVLDGIDHEILVVDTEHPLDDTAQTIRDFANHKIIHTRRKGQNYGDAVRHGLKLARGRWVVFMSADMQHRPETITDLWRNKEDMDMVAASRYVQGGGSALSYSLIIKSVALNKLCQFLYGKKLRDYSSEYRLCRGDDLRKLELSANHFAIIVEMAAQLMILHPGYRIQEMPFTIQQRFHGQTKRRSMPFYWDYATTFFRLWQLKTFTRYLF